MDEKWINMYEDALYSFIVSSIRLFPSKARISTCKKKNESWKIESNLAIFHKAYRPCHKYVLSWGVRSYLTCLTPPPEVRKLPTQSMHYQLWEMPQRYDHAFRLFESPPNMGNFMTFITDLVITYALPAHHLGNAPAPSEKVEDF